MIAKNPDLNGEGPFSTSIWPIQEGERPISDIPPTVHDGSVSREAMAMQNSFDQNLTKLTDDARRQAAAQERLKRSDRAMAAALSGTFAGTLIELAETRSPVTIRTRAADTIYGVIAGLGPDVVIVSPNDGASRVFLRQAAIEALVEHGSGHDRYVEPITSGPGLSGLLDDYVEGNERIALTMSTGNRFMGSILRVGDDQIVLRLDGDADTLTVPLVAVDQVVLAR